MTAPNMATITATLERSLQNCSLHNQERNRVDEGVINNHHHEDGIGSSSSSYDNQNHNHNHLDEHQQQSDAALELNSHISLPYHWEQCLDLKTGEIYYINWRNGMKAKEDPRRTRVEESSNINGDFYYSEDDENSSYDSEESSSESSDPSSSREHCNNANQVVVEEKENNSSNKNVLVVAGCKTCLMYFMVPKQGEDCPKCNGQLLHFDRSENGSSP